MNDDIDVLSFNLSLSQFRKKPSELIALSTFLKARKCSKEIPVDIIDMIAPSIEKAYKEKISQVLERIEKKAENYNNNQILLSIALEERSIELACKRYLEHSKENIEIPSLRKRLERLLKDEIDSYIKNSRLDASEFSKYFPFKNTETTKMLDFYRDFILAENAEESDF